MNLIRIFIAILLSVFSTIVMSYIALAAAIGPSIKTTLVLMSMFLFKMVLSKSNTSDYTHGVALTTVAGGIGGILATGLAFSLPTLYFLSPDIFQTWMNSPFYFCAVVSSFCFAAGSYGLLMANLFEGRLLVQQQMRFPIGELVFNAIASPGQLRKSLELVVGFCGTQIFLCAHAVSGFFSSSLVLFNRISWSIFTVPAVIIPLDQVPMYLAVGFVTGHVIAIPLIVGFLAKIVCLDPLFYVYTHPDAFLHTWFFSRFATTVLTSSEFTLAFCSGMILYGCVLGFFDLFVSWYKNCKKNLFTVKNRSTLAWIQIIIAVGVTTLFLKYYNFSFIQQALLISMVALCIYAMVLLVLRGGVVTSWGYFPVIRPISMTKIFSEIVPALMQQQSIPWLQISFVMSGNMAFLYYCNFTIAQQCYLLIFSAVCIYQMLIIAGRIGIIPLGRFATFVMVPGMFLFNFDCVQVTLVAAFVEVAGGVAGDVLFGRKLAQLAKIKPNQSAAYRWLGLLVSSLIIGGVFWLFIHNLGLGPVGLPATKAASRALLIAFKNFDWYVLMMGFIFGYFIKYVKVNPALLLGGILMPPSLSLILIIGGLLTYITSHKERYYPFLSGVSAGNCIWMLVQALFKVV